MATARRGGRKGKRDQIVAAAARLFLERGYAATSMDAVTQEAGVSKATVYAHFPSKADLLGAIVRCRCEENEVLDVPEAVREKGPREVLRWYGSHFADLALSDDALNLFRLLVAEAPRSPELGRAFYEAGPVVVYGALSAYLADCDRRGLLKVLDPVLVAENFIAMIRGRYYLQVLLGLAQPGDRAQVDRVVEGAVAMVMGAMDSAKTLNH